MTNKNPHEDNTPHIVPPKVAISTEVEQGYILAMDKARWPSGKTRMELLRILNNICEQHRREQIRLIDKSISSKLCATLDVGEVHLHLKGTLEEKILQAVDRYNNR